MKKTKKAFRELLNQQDKESQTNGNAIWKKGAYHQRTRLYGDYLYQCDPIMFDIHYIVGSDLAIDLYFEPEHIHPDDCFDWQALGGDEYRNKILNDIDDGNLYWVTAVVKCSLDGILLCETSIGGCLYESVKDFMEGGYYQDLKNETITGAMNRIKELQSKKVA